MSVLIMNHKKVLYYDRIDVCEAIDWRFWNKWIKRVQYLLLWYFLNKGFKFQTDVCNRCHDLLKIFMNVSNVSILKGKCADYRCIITGFSKSEAIKLLQRNWFDWKKWNIIRKINIQSNFETINLLRILIYGKF